MDREIPKEVRQKERNKKIIRYSAIGLYSAFPKHFLLKMTNGTGLPKRKPCPVFCFYTLRS